MTDFAALLQPDRGQAARTLHMVDRDALDDWLAGQPPRARAAVAAQRFQARAGDFALLPGEDAEDWSAAVGGGDPPGPWDLAAAVARLPGGSYRAAGACADATLGWLLAQHRFDRYRRNAEPQPMRVLLTSDVARIDDRVRLAAAVALVRDMIDAGASDMGPAEIEAAVREAAAPYAAQVSAVEGDALARDFPMVHAVGRAAVPARASRLVTLDWGNPAHPAVTIVGKGVCFDTGGLDIKPAAGMRLMKKDMGGAAHAVALARLVMQAALPVHLRLIVPAVENAIAGDAFRPGDVLTSRSGLSVEIANTDAEGRLILADALAFACEDRPALLIDFATLTGAARVALGPDLPALFANDDALAADLIAAGEAVADPLWRLPLWPGYRDMLKSDVADLNNAPEGGFAGSITAALFLQRFVTDTPWAHVDTFAWTPVARPGRPRGGEALGLRAAWEMLRRRFAAS